LTERKYARQAALEKFRSQLVRLEKISVAIFFQDANVRAERKRYAVLQNEALLMLFSSFSNKPFVYY
jgi:hypothetical protein